MIHDAALAPQVNGHDGPSSSVRPLRPAAPPAAPPPLPPAPAYRSNGRGYDTNPTSILDELDRWAARLDELSSEYADIAVEAAEKRELLEYEKACARERAKRRPNPRDRRTKDDVSADVTRSAKVHPLALEVVGLEARLDAIRVQLRNAERQMDRMRTHEATARVLDPRRPGQ